MKFHALMLTLAAAALAVDMAYADTITHGSTSVTIDFVSVGNPGNAPDTAGDPNPCGAVTYSYSIGKYEITADQWAIVRGADSNVGNEGNWSNSQPTAGTSWDEAAKFCNWLTTGNANSGYYTITGGTAAPNALSHSAYAATYGTTYFIPTQDEWYKAAYYNGSGSYYTYPTGKNTVPDGINYLNDPAFDAVFNDGYNQGRPNAVTSSGVTGPYGTYGQGGNTWEWNETAYGASRVARGGCWSSTSDKLASSLFSYYPPASEYNVLGFRVAMIPEPSVATLLACVIIAGIIWRRCGK